MPQEITQSTPHSAGCSSDVVYQSQTTQEHYKNYLETDITATVVIEFNKFLEIVFEFAPENWIKEDSTFKTITRSPRFRTLLKEYREKAGRETERYHPFNELTNHIIKMLSKNQQPIVVCRNDHVAIEGSFACRIPDCVVVSKKASEHPNRINWEKMSNKGTIDQAFHWSELLAFVEFKVKSTSSSKAIQPNNGGTGRTSSISRTQQLGHSSVSSARNVSPRDSSPASAVGSASSTYSTATSASSRKRRGNSLPVPSGKRRKNVTEVGIQCASYALEMLSHGGLRTHVLSALVTNCKIELLYYDRSLPVKSKPVDFDENPAALVALMYCMQHSTPSQWGTVTKIALAPDPLSLYKPRPALTTCIASPFNPSQPAPAAALVQAMSHPLRGALLTLLISELKVVLELGALVFAQYALIGRGTCVVHATVVGDCPESWKNQSIVVKFSFSPTTRTCEGEILGKILGITNTPAVKEGDPPPHTWVVNHLPGALHYETVVLNEKEDTQSRMSAYLKSQGIEYEDRALQILVMTELFPVTQLKTSNELVPVIRDVFKCYRWLYEKAEVIHRDISLNNIMYRKAVNNDGSINVYGVLSDYDLSLFFKEPKHNQTSKQRTGTRPYMAVDLLEPFPVKHLYRHDLESLFYAIVVLVSRYDQGKEIENPPLQDWFELPPKLLLAWKTTFITRVSPPQPTPAFRNMDPLVFGLRKLFKDGYSEQSLRTDFEISNGEEASQCYSRGSVHYP